MSIARLEREADINRLTAARRAELRLSAPQLERGVELDRMAAPLLGERRFLLFREMAVLPRELREDEQVLDLAYAHVFFGSGLLVLTDRQILFVNDRLVLPGVAIKRFDFESIRGHSVVTVKDFGRLTLHLDGTGWYAEREFDRVQPLERALAIDGKLSEILLTGREA